MNELKEMFGSMVFNDTVMRDKLSKDTYRSLMKTISDGTDLDITVANEVANVMKDWAAEHGATHYTHWFQPLTGVTAEKHDSFLSLQRDGSVIVEFSGKNLIKGEPDASSFPSGGLRATFEARGYTAWDPTSYAFIKDNTLYIPTVFCSYGGEVLDKKTPLLRSCEALNEQALRVLRLIGDNQTKRVVSKTGAEQEYFLVDKNDWLARRDLILTGHTLFGAPAPKGQELGDHYFGSIKPRVKDFMKDLDSELWKLGVYVTTEHNEAAPAQHELAPKYTDTNTAADHNQLTMELLKKVADRHGMVCLLDEKPFDGINGSGKHNNWSIATGNGDNLLNPGVKPFENSTFLLFLAAVITAVDEYQDLLRIFVASAANDRRLGGDEAPPAILSVYLGDELAAILECIESGKKYYNAKDSNMKTGVHVIPDFRKDNTDRNRTSPFSFSGNKFEFRMPGSSQSISDSNMVLNTIMAKVLSDFADRLSGKKKTDAAARRIIRDAIRDHGRIIFNGNNYSKEWEKEAQKRGLSNYRTSADAIPHLTDKKNIELFTKMNIFTEAEVRSRCDIMLENYCMVLNIEALTMLDMARKQILPAVLKYSGDLADRASVKATVGISAGTEIKLSGKLSSYAEEILSSIKALEEAVQAAHATQPAKRAACCKEKVIPAMKALRTAADKAEIIIPEEYSPFPTYEKLLFGI